MSFRNHLYGNNKNEGLVSQLSKRVGIIQKLSKQVSTKKLKCFIEGIFYSKLNYCLPLYGNVFGLEIYKDANTKYRSYTKRDNNKLQVLQNKVCRILTKSGSRAPTVTLLDNTESLSVQQMIALQTIIMTHKILRTSKPSYIANKIRYAENKLYLRSSCNLLQNLNIKLNQSKEGFINRAIILYNKLDDDVKMSPSLNLFKKEARKWVKVNIPVKPQDFQGY